MASKQPPTATATFSLANCRASEEVHDEVDARTQERRQRAR